MKTPKQELSSGPVGLKVMLYIRNPGGLYKAHIAGPATRVSDLVDLGTVVGPKHLHF